MLGNLFRKMILWTDLIRACEYTSLIERVSNPLCQGVILRNKILPATCGLTHRLKRRFYA
jgi:hypothetical protein